MRSLSPIGWAIRPIKNYAKFSGRASRAEFWWFFLFIMLIYIAFWILMFSTMGFSAASGSQNPMAAFGALGAMGIFVMLFYLVLLIPSIAVQVRRLHDTNRSGWWLGAFWLLYAGYVLFAVRAAFSATSVNSQPSLAGAGTMMVIGLLFFAYSIALLVFFCLPGTKGSNRFGDDPYGPDVEQVFA